MKGIRKGRVRITHLTHDMSKSGSIQEEGLVSGSGFYQPPPKQTFGAKLKAHVKRHWKIHLAIFVVGFLATTFPMFVYCPCHTRRNHKLTKNDVFRVYVIYPLIAQHTVNDAKVTINSLHLSNPTPDGFQLAINTTFASNPMYKANLNAFNASLYLPGSDVSFVEVEVPASVSGAKTDLIIDQRVHLDHPEEITKYSIVTFANESYSYDLKGKGHLRLGGLPKISVKYDKTVTQQGRASPESAANPTSTHHTNHAQA
jgi:hypothetical protein